MPKWNWGGCTAFASTKSATTLASHRWSSRKAYGSSFGSTTRRFTCTFLDQQRCGTLVRRYRQKVGLNLGVGMEVAKEGVLRISPKRLKHLKRIGSGISQWEEVYCLNRFLESSNIILIALIQHENWVSFALIRTRGLTRQNRIFYSGANEGRIALPFCSDSESNLRSYL